MCREILNLAPCLWDLEPPEEQEISVCKTRIEQDLAALGREIALRYPAGFADQPDSSIWLVQRLARLHPRTQQYLAHGPI